MIEIFEQLYAYLQGGGFVMWPLAISTILLWYGLGYRQLLLKRGFTQSLEICIESVHDNKWGPAKGIIDSAVILGVTEFNKPQFAPLHSRLDDCFFPFYKELSRFATLVKAIVIIAPLAGLLGTVSGMIETFDALGNMTLFNQAGGGIAGGISQALISTQMGLAIAIPGLLAGRLLERRQEQLEQELDQLKEWLCANANDPIAHQELDLPSSYHDSPKEDLNTKGINNMRYRHRKKSSSDGLDISPLIDMVFILLIFFMVSTTFVKDMKIDLKRPSAQSASRASTKSIRVHLDRAGAIYVEGAPVKSWMLQSRVRQLLRGQADRPVLVVTDQIVQAQKLISVIDQCRLAGAADVGVATRKETG